jgi:hypothetical protein
MLSQNVQARGVHYSQENLDVLNYALPLILRAHARVDG